MALNTAQITDVLHNIAEKGANLCLERLLHPEDVDIKEGDEIVSILDREISAMLKEALQKAAFFEDDKNILVDEETTPQPTPEEIEKSSYVVIVDPVDGSGAAIEGRAEYCVMLGLFEHVGDGILQPVTAVVVRPKLREKLSWSAGGEITQVSDIGTNKQRQQVGVKAICNPFAPRHMLFDYKFWRMFKWSDNPRAHMNPSGFNLCDIALHRGLGFTFVYKPWDIIPLALCYATGIKSYVLTADIKGIFTAEEVTALHMNWFDYDAQKCVYGKIKKPLLFCKAEDLPYILSNLTAA